MISSRTPSEKMKNKKRKRPLFWKTAGDSGKGEENKNRPAAVTRIRAQKTKNKNLKSF